MKPTVRLLDGDGQEVTADGYEPVEFGAWVVDDETGEVYNSKPIEFSAVRETVRVGAVRVGFGAPTLMFIDADLDGLAGLQQSDDGCAVIAEGESVVIRAGDLRVETADGGSP